MNVGMTRGEMIRLLVKHGYEEADAKDLPTAMLKDMVMLILNNNQEDV